ncbi:MAG: FUSC family protein [Rhodospirillales bacterium]|nr:FUSC family protein [Rhodospirillales bacterium]
MPLLSRLARRITARTIGEVECVASVLLAILFAHLLGAQNVAWAAYAGFMVMRGHISETLTRAALRCVGTITAGLLALFLVPAVQGAWVANAALLFVIGTAALFAALTTRRSYAWLFFGLTYAMIALDHLRHPDQAVGAFVATRILETLAGTVAAALVSIAAARTLRRRWPAMHPPAAALAPWRPAARHATQAGIALVLLVAMSHFLALPGLSQGAITVMAVMLIPPAAITAGGLAPVGRRIALRFLGCALGGAYAALVLLAADAQPAGLILGTGLGAAIGRHIESGDPARAYIGTQFALAMLIVLVPDRYAGATIAVALQRLSGIFLGMLSLEPVLLAWRIPALLAGRRARAG